MKISQVVVADGCLILLTGYFTGSQVRTASDFSTPAANSPKVCIGVSVYDKYSDDIMDNRHQHTKVIDLQTNTDKQRSIPSTLNLGACPRMSFSPTLRYFKKQCSQYQLYGCACFFEMPRFEKKCLFLDKLLEIPQIIWEKDYLKEARTYES